MKVPHFLKAKSRLGLPYIPMHQSELNIGVENGPDAILTENFLKNFPESQISTFEFPLPENIDPENFNKVLSGSVENFRDLITSSLKPGQIQVVVGGDHSITLASELAVIKRLERAETMGHIQFDSHGDINLKRESPTNNFHGMYLRPLFDMFDIPEIEKLSQHKIPTKNIIYVGNLDLDYGEREFLNKNNIRNIDRNEILNNKTEVLKFFESYINNFKHIHVSFDMDGLDKSIAPATGIPAEDGLMLEDVRELLSIASKHPSLSFDIAEVNPDKPGSERTIKTAQEILSLILS